MSINDCLKWQLRLELCPILVILLEFHKMFLHFVAFSSKSIHLRFNHRVEKKSFLNHVWILFDRWMDRQTNRQMDRHIDSPCILQDIVPFGAAAQKRIFFQSSWAAPYPHPLVSSHFTPSPRLWSLFCDRQINNSRPFFSPNSVKKIFLYAHYMKQAESPDFRSEQQKAKC